MWLATINICDFSFYLNLYSVYWDKNFQQLGSDWKLTTNFVNLTDNLCCITSVIQKCILSIQFFTTTAHQKLLIAKSSPKIFISNIYNDYVLKNCHTFYVYLHILLYFHHFHFEHNSVSKLSLFHTNWIRRLGLPPFTFKNELFEREPYFWKHCLSIFVPLYEIEGKGNSCT